MDTEATPSNRQETIVQDVTAPPEGGLPRQVSAVPRPARIALLADLGEPVSADAITETGVVTYEMARAVQAWSGNTGSATVDHFARRGSWRGLPLVSVDPDELKPVPDDPVAWFAAQEAVYGQLWSGGMLTGYDIVHA